MKPCSAATLSLLAGRQYLLAELYQITLVSGQVYRFTNFQVPLNAPLYTGTTVGGSTFGSTLLWNTGLVIKRETITQKCGVEAGGFKLTLAPQLDSPNNPVLISGYPLLQAALYGLLDNATVLLAKLIVPIAMTPVVVSSGGTPYFQGTVQKTEADRSKLILTIDDYLAGLTIQMPPTLLQTGCPHTVYDAFCDPAGTLKSSKTITGKVGSTVTSGAQFYTTPSGGGSWNGTSYPDGYFNLGVIKMTSGVNSGLSAKVKSFFNTNGVAMLAFPFPTAPSTGDTFSWYPGCDYTQSTCTNKFANLAHFKGMPYIPVPETIVDGGTSTAYIQPAGAQAGLIIGSSASATLLPPGS